MSDIPEPEISPAFTLEDIRKIRDWNCERRKRMTPEEFREARRRGAERFLAQLDNLEIAPEIIAEVNRRFRAADDD